MPTRGRWTGTRSSSAPRRPTQDQHGLHPNNTIHAISTTVTMPAAMMTQ
jgi:hypothetical protein